jgi:hypothetical protein
MPPSSGASASTGAASAAASTGPVGSAQSNDTSARMSNKRKVQTQLPPAAKKSPSKRSLSTSTSSSSSISLSASSASSASPATTRDINTNSNKSDEQNQNVRVVARLRPLSNKEIGENSKEAIKASGGKATSKAFAPASASAAQIIVEGQRTFEYDAVFGPLTTQEEVYKATAANTVEKNIFRGFNVTILAYGQTGSGRFNWVALFWVALQCTS